jgi:hypothetical protein
MARALRIVISVVMVAWATGVAAQPDPQPDQPQPQPQPDPQPPDPQPDEPPPEPVAIDQGLRIHIITTRRTYLPMEYDIYSVATEQPVATGRGADEARGEEARLWDLAPGTYKIVKKGEPFGTQTDFATVIVGDGVTDFVIVVDADSGFFRGSGPLVGELPEGIEIGGIKVALNGGGNLMFNQKSHAIGTTSGTSYNVGVFANFGLVLDRQNHFLDVSSELQLNVVDPATGSAFGTTDLLQGSAIYTYKINNPYIGPYVRAGFRTRVNPGHLYLTSNTGSITINTTRLDGTMDTVTVGTQANPDSLRIEVAPRFAPFLIQEEVGANVKAVDVDLVVLQLVVGTRVGYAFRQGLTNELLVVDGADTGPVINLREVDDYFTSGPNFGANAKVTVTRWLFGSANFNMLIPVQDRDRAGSSFAKRLLIDFAGTAGLRIPALTRFLFASFDYTFRVERDGYLTSDTQFDHTLMARANLTLF